MNECYLCSFQIAFLKFATMKLKVHFPFSDEYQRLFIYLSSQQLAFPADHKAIFTYKQKCTFDVFWKRDVVVAQLLTVEHPCLPFLQCNS